MLFGSAVSRPPDSRRVSIVERKRQLRKRLFLAQRLQVERVRRSSPFLGYSLLNR